MKIHRILISILCISAGVVSAQQPMQTVRQVPTVAALKNIAVVSANDGLLIETLGYSAANDGGGGTWIYYSSSVATANDATVATPSGGIGRWIRSFTGPVNVRWFGAKGDASTDDTTVIQNAITTTATASQGLYIPAGTYKITAPINLPSNTIISGDGYNSLIQSAVAGTFQFFQSLGRATNTAQSNIAMRGLRFRRTNNLAGNEGPFDGCVQLANCSKVLVSNCVFESSMTGVHFYECQGFEARSCAGYSQGDVAVRVNTDGLNPSAERGVINDCYSYNAGYQLDGITPCPEPAGPIGDAFITTQSDTSWFNCVAVNPRHQAFETGGVIKNLLVDGFYAIADIGGRGVGMLVNEVKGGSVRNVKFVLHNNGSGGLNCSGGTQTNIDFSVISLLNDYVPAAGVQNNALISIGSGSSFIRVSAAKAVGGSIVVGGGDNITLSDCEASGNNSAGFRLATATNITATNCKAFDNGVDATIDTKQRAGFVLDNAGAGIRILGCYSGDTRAGGSRTQTYGVYVATSQAIDFRGNVLSNNITAAVVMDGSSTASNVNVQSTPNVFTKAGTISDSDFVVTPPDGAVAVDTADGRIYVRSGGAWIYFTKSGP